MLLCFFFFNDTATTEIYTLSLHDALPILGPGGRSVSACGVAAGLLPRPVPRSEEHTSELQSQSNLVCRLLLEKKKIGNNSSSMRTCYYNKRFPQAAFALRSHDTSLTLTAT